MKDEHDREANPPMKYDIGASVLIWEDPVTKERFEGTATLKELYRINGMSSWWRVHFEGDAEDEFYERCIVLEPEDEILCEATGRPREFSE